VIGRAQYGHSAVLHAILATERRGSREPAGSLGDEREPRAYHREHDGERPACRTVTLEDVEAIADPGHACAALEQDVRHPVP
jgi:hypothetical protein